MGFVYLEVHRPGRARSDGKVGQASACRPCCSSASRNPGALKRAWEQSKSLSLQGTASQAAEKSASLGSWLSEPLFFRVQRPFFLLFRSSFRGCCAPPKTPRPSPTPPESVSRDAADWPPWPTSGTTSSPSSLRAPSPAVECCSISPNQTLSRLACASSG